MDSRSKLYSFSNIVLYLLLFLACMNFMGRGPIVFLVFCFFGVMTTRRVFFDQTCLLYLFLTVFACLASIVFYDIVELIKSIVYFLSFYTGYRLCLNQEKTLPFFTNIIFWGVFGFTASLIYFGYLNLFALGHIAGERVMVSPWTNEEVAVTLIGLMSSVPLIYSFYCIFCQKKMWLKLLGAVMIIISFIINTETATRTPFLLFAMVYAIMLYVLLRGSTVKRRLHLTLLFAALVVVALYFIEHNASKSAITDRFSEEGLQTTRIDIISLYLQHMWDYPLGGGFIRNQYHYLAHNIIQESYDTYGVFFFFCLLVILVGMFKRVLKLYSLKEKSKLTYLLMSFYFGIIIQIMSEPVIIGYPQLLWLFFFVDGVVVGAFSRKNELLTVNKLEFTR